MLREAWRRGGTQGASLSGSGLRHSQEWSGHGHLPGRSLLILPVSEESVPLTPHCWQGWGPSGSGGEEASVGRGRTGLTHFWKVSWLLRKGKKEGSQTSPWSRQASAQALPAAASQAWSELVGGQDPGARLEFRAHSRWVALGARMKGLCGAWAPGGAGPGAAQKS